MTATAAVPATATARHPDADPAPCTPTSLTSAARLYAEALRAVRSGQPAGVLVREDGGGCVPLPLESWYADRRPGDAGVLARCRGATLDLGCGPGRLVAALGIYGLPALGIDVSASAVTLTRARGAEAMRGSVFEPLPDEGAWRTLLLVDGNIGIGGDPAALLRRCRALVRPAGRLLVELHPTGPARSLRLRLESGRRRSEWFPWAHVGVDVAPALARHTGWDVAELWTEAGRWFVALTLR